VSSPPHGLETGVYIASADGSGSPRRISRDGDTPQYGAKNDEVFITRTASISEVEVRRALWRVRLQGGEDIEVARGEFISEYNVSPDGRWLGFIDRFHAYVLPLPSTG
jgi:hypothetical protein